MKIVIDSAIPFIKGVFEPYCTVEYINGDSINRDNIKDATALLIRTRTKCNRELLEGSSVKHIATATIGFDHIDIPYCEKSGIEVSTAAGCNARAVLQWVGATLAYISSKEDWAPKDKTIGIVGVGNVGRLVAQYTKLWGFNTLECDPPRKEVEGGDFISFDELASKADIITFHTPLNDSTRHLINSQSTQNIRRNALIINSSRGEVVDTIALLESTLNFALDVWSDEPNINCEALERALIATPHIAGYSRQGKANATMMAVQNIAHALSLPLTEWRSEVKEVKPIDISWDSLCKTIGNNFDIEAQSNYLKAHKELFEEIRNTYDYREEYF